MIVVVNATREQWREIERASSKCSVSEFTARTLLSHGNFIGVAREKKRSSCGIAVEEARALLSALQESCDALSKRPRFLESPKFAAMRDAASALSDALNSSGFVSE